MDRVQIPPPGRLIISIITSSMDGLADSLTALERRFGRVECETIEIECAKAEQYREEMGDRLQRRFYSFERPMARQSLTNAKAICRKIESGFSDRVEEYIFRSVNIDPGILSPGNLVMASNREYNHRIYLGDGVFGELTLVWARGQFVRLPWTNPDFCSDEAIEFFRRVWSCFDLIDQAQAS